MDSHMVDRSSPCNREDLNVQPSTQSANNFGILDKMPLHKEPKRKRIQDEDEILRQYRASTSKPKRKYKQRKSKYDPELWDYLPLHKSSKKMEHEDVDFIEGDKEKISAKTDSYGNVTSVQPQLEISCNQEISYSTEKGEGLVQISTLGNGETILSSEDASRLACSESTVFKDDYGNTLLARKILGFLLDENSAVEKRNMIHTLMLDARLKYACLTEIQTRRRYLSTLHDVFLPKLKKEGKFLLDIFKYLNPCQSTVKVGNAPENTNHSNQKNRETDDFSIIQNEILSFPTSCDDSIIVNERRNTRTENFKEDVLLSTLAKSFYQNKKKESEEMYATNNEDITQHLDNEIIGLSIDSFQGWSRMEDYLLLSPQQSTQIEEDMDENTNHESKTHSVGSNIGHNGRNTHVESDRALCFADMNDFHLPFPSQTSNNDVDINENSALNYSENNLPNMPNIMQNQDVDFDRIHSSSDSNTNEMFRLAEIIANST